MSSIGYVCLVTPQTRAKAAAVISAALTCVGAGPPYVTLCSCQWWPDGRFVKQRRHQCLAVRAGVEGGPDARASHI